MDIIESFRLYFPIMVIIVIGSFLQIHYTGESWAMDFINYLPEIMGSK